MKNHHIDNAINTINSRFPIESSRGGGALLRLFFITFLAATFLASSLMADSSLRYVIEKADPIISPGIESIVVVRVIAPAGNHEAIRCDATSSPFTKLFARSYHDADSTTFHMYLHLRPDSTDVGQQSVKLFLLQDFSDYVEFNYSFQVGSTWPVKFLPLQQKEQVLIPNHHRRVLLTQTDGSYQEVRDGKWTSLNIPGSASLVHYNTKACLGKESTWLWDDNTLLHHQESKVTTTNWADLSVDPSKIIGGDCDDSGTLYLLIKGGQVVMINETEVKRLTLSDTKVTQLLCTSQGPVCASVKGLSYFNMSKQLKTVLYPSGYMNSTSINLCFDLIEEKSGSILVGCLSYSNILDSLVIFRCTPDKATPIYCGDTTKRMTARFVQTSQGDVYIVGDRGRTLVFQLGTDGLISHSCLNFTSAMVLSESGPYSAEADADGGIWFYNGDGGLTRRFDATATLTSAVAEEPFPNTMDFSASPNPASQTITFHTPESSQSTVFVVRDILGWVRTQFVVPASGNCQLDVQAWPTGSYVCSDGYHLLPFVVLH